MHFKTKSPQYKTWIEISKSSLLHNLKQFKKMVGTKTKIAAVVKANAYGHGLYEVVGILNTSCDWFCVDSIEEGLMVRRLTPKPILILGYTPLSRLKEAVMNDLSIVVYNNASIEKIINLNLPKKAKLHIKVETGLNRQGVKGESLLSFAEYILKNNKKLYLEGMSTHFANIEDTLDPSFAKLQLKKFKEAISQLKRNGINPLLIHCAASAATFLYPDTRFNMVRAGIALYGLWPSRETKIALRIRKRKLILKPVLSWKSMVVQVKEIGAGESVGYGRTWIAPRKTKIAIIPIGYADGYDRKLSGSSRVLIKGKFAPVIGRVAMNMIVIDISSIKNVSIEDEVVLIGLSGKERISVEEVAEKIGTINYEVVARIASSIKKVVVT